MPLPKPNADDTQKEFISRCMANPRMISEYPNIDQRLAICYTQWKEK